MGTKPFLFRAEVHALLYCSLPRQAHPMSASDVPATESGYKTPEPMKRPTECPGAPMKKKRRPSHGAFFVPLNLLSPTPSTTASPNASTSPNASPPSSPLVVNMVAIENVLQLHLNVIYLNPPHDHQVDEAEVASQFHDVDLNASNDQV